MDSKTFPTGIRTHPTLTCNSRYNQFFFVCFLCLGAVFVSFFLSLPFFNVFAGDSSPSGSVSCLDVDFPLASWSRLASCHATTSTWSHALHYQPARDVLSWTWCMCRNIPPIEWVWVRGATLQLAFWMHPRRIPCLAFQSCCPETWRPWAPLGAVLWVCPRPFCSNLNFERWIFLCTPGHPLNDVQIEKKTLCSCALCHHSTHWSTIACNEFWFGRDLID